MPIDVKKTAETMAECDTYSGWATKYLRGDFDFRDLWNEAKGVQAEIVPGTFDTRPIEPEVEDEPDKDAEIARLRRLLEQAEVTTEEVPSAQA